MHGNRSDDPIWLRSLERSFRHLTAVLTILAAGAVLYWFSQWDHSQRDGQQTADDVGIASETVPPSIRALSASSDGQFLEAFHGPATWRRYDAYTGRELLSRDIQSDARYSLTLTSDQGLMISLQFGHRLEITSPFYTLVQEDFPERGPRESISQCSLARNRPLIAAVSTAGSLWLLEFDEEAIRSVSRHVIGQPLNNLTVSPDGQFIAFTTQDARLLIWDVQQQRIILEQTEGPFNVHFVEWSTDGTRLITSGLAPQVSVWDAATLTRSIEWNVDAQMTHATALSSTGELAAAADDESIHVWDVATGQEQFFLTGHLGIVSALQFSHDDRSLFSADLKGELRRWSLIDGREIWCVQDETLRG